MSKEYALKAKAAVDAERPRLDKCNAQFGEKMMISATVDYRGLKSGVILTAFVTSSAE